ncbi:MULTISPECIES: phage holin family protein [Cryobacterium]|uniref:phage holin family protein n=1 Tax=Cryobacterium TaxID=69578 RepID=UPI00135C47F1|nr:MULTISPECIES: phage holin family protein [Cryobacterium]
MSNSGVKINGLNGNGLNPKIRRSLSSLLGELPGQIGALVQAELQAFKAEMADKAKNVGFGVALFVVAGVLAFFATGVLVAVAVIALALVLPLWLAGLLVALAMLLIAFLLALLGRNRVKAGTATDPNGLTASIRRDVDVFKGVGDYEH